MHTQDFDRNTQDVFILVAKLKAQVVGKKSFSNLVYGSFFSGQTFLARKIVGSECVPLFPDHTHGPFSFMQV